MGQYKRKKKLINSALQLKLVGVFLAIACAASLFQVVLLNRSLRAFADHMPDGGGAILAGMPAMLVSNMLLTVSARSIDGAEAAVEHGARS